MVLINGKAAGMDVLSRARAYRALHPKLLKSYAVEAFLNQGKKMSRLTLERARGFFSCVAECEEREYRSVGLEWGHRFLGRRMVGSALLYRRAVIHAAFFETAQAERAGRIADLSYRRGFRL